MTKARRIGFVFLGGTLLSAAAQAQVPDLLNAFDVGGRSMGMGGALNVSDATTLASFYNPAGLAYIDKREIGIAYRNLPKSRTVVTGNLADPRFNSHGSRGDSEVTHVGYAAPISEMFGRGAGTIALSYTLGGFIDDIAVGPAAGIGSDAANTFTVANYRREMRARADYYTLAYGRTNASQNLAFGLGLAYVQQHVAFSESGSASSGGSPVPFGTAGTLDSTGNGLGVIAGILYIPANNPNLGFGLSYRSEINLSNNRRTAAFYDKIPARLIAGASYRRDGLRGGKDFMVFGAQVQHFFDASNAMPFERDPQTTIGFGVEYSYARDTFRIPIRIGYFAVPKGGDTFGSRNTFTYGIGYRPNGSDYTVDLNWGAPQGSGYDFGISATYRFK